MSTELSTFVRRVLTLADDEAVEVVVAIYRPEEEVNGDYVCRYSVIGANVRREKAAHGVDEVQALLLALCATKAELGILERRGLRLLWLGDSDLGFDLLQLAIPPIGDPDRG